MSHSDALVQPLRGSALLEENRRTAIRHACSLETTYHPHEDGEGISWGAVVEDISTRGIGISLCYPFRPGTYLTVDLPSANGLVRSVLVRVVHVRDRSDGAWHLGCEFIKPLTDSDMEMLL
jgi:hypothetical protein